MASAADPSYPVLRPVARPAAEPEPSWGPALRIACATVARNLSPDVSAVSVVVTLTRELADAAALVAFSQDLAMVNGLHAELQSFAPPTFTVRFSRDGTAAPGVEGVDA